jgi:hypothetical protein
MNLRERTPGVARRAAAAAQHRDRVLHLVPHDARVVRAREQVPHDEVGAHPGEQVIEDAGQSSLTTDPVDVVHPNLTRAP